MENIRDFYYQGDIDSRAACTSIHTAVMAFHCMVNGSVLPWPRGKVPSAEELLCLLALTEGRLCTGIPLSEGQTASELDLL